MRRVSTQIVVSVEGDRPRLINWGGRTLLVRTVQDRWTVQRTAAGKGEVRLYYRVETQAGLLHIYRDGERWFLSRVVH